MIKIAINRHLNQDLDQLLVIAPPVALTADVDGAADLKKKKKTLIKINY